MSEHEAKALLLALRLYEKQRLYDALMNGIVEE